MKNLSLVHFNRGSFTHRIIGGWPIPKQSFFDEFEQLFGSMLRSPTLSPKAEGEGQRSPLVDIREVAGGFLLEVELPGFDEKDIDISIDGKTLIIEAECKAQVEGDGGDLSYAGRQFGKIRRTFMLNEVVDPEGITAKFSNGVLALTIPKVQVSEREVKKISIG